MTKVAILSSHNGSGFNALYQASLDKTLPIEIVLLISNNANSGALENAKKRGIKNQLVNTKTNDNPDETIYKLLKDSQCSYIFLSGYMKKVSLKTTQEFTILNSHPALLPKYGGKGMYGNLVHEAVLANNEKTTGVTIHQVNEVYDEGEIVLQKELKVLKDDSIESLATRVKELEAIAIVEAFQKSLAK